MARKKIIDSGKTARRVEVTGKSQRRVDPDEFAAAIGAEPKKWKLMGLDTFEGEYYSLDGEWETEAQARSAAASRLASLEKTQPTESSGGQSFMGIQDRVYVVRPDGTTYRYTGGGK